MRRGGRATSTWTNTVVPAGSSVGTQRLGHLWGDGSSYAQPLVPAWGLPWGWGKGSELREGKNWGLKLRIVSSVVLAALLFPLASDTNFPSASDHSMSLGSWLRDRTWSTAPFSIRHRSHRGRLNTPHMLLPNGQIDVPWVYSCNDSKNPHPRVWLRMDSGVCHHQLTLTQMAGQPRRGHVLWQCTGQIPPWNYRLWYNSWDGQACCFHLPPSLWGGLLDSRASADQRIKLPS